MEKKERFDVYKDVTRRIVEKLRSGVIPWQGLRPYDPAEGPVRACNYVTRREYSLLNRMLLGDDREYITFKQASSLKGAGIRKGAKAKRVTFFSMVEKKVRPAAGATETEEEEGKPRRKEEYPVLRYYNVFAIDDCEGVASRRSAPKEHTLVLSVEDAVGAYLVREGITLQPTGAPAYEPARDVISIPDISRWTNRGDYYATLARLAVRSTGTPSRLDRGVEPGVTLGERNGAREELIGEMGAALLLAACGMDPAEYLDSSAAYAARWADVLEEDWRAVVWAAGRAEKAVSRILTGPKEEAGKEAA